MPPELEVALRAVTALGAFGGIALLFRVRADKRKIKAETAKVEVDASAAMTGTALSLIEPLRSEITHCNDEVLRLRQMIARIDTDDT